MCAARVSNRLVVTAYHEAGHAVARLWLHLPFKEASVIPKSTEGTLGHVLARPHPPWFNPERDRKSPRARARMEDEIISRLAGQVAEAKFTSRKPRHGMESDNQRALDIAMYVGSEETVRAYWRYCFARTQDLVSARWREIKFVAEALAKGRRLTREQVMEVINKLYGFPPLTIGKRGAPPSDIAPGPPSTAEQAR